MDPNLEFVRLWRPSKGAVVLSAEAFTLTSAAVVASLDYEPGFVSDDFVAGWPVDANILVAELCLNSVWKRAAGGYRIDQPLLDVLMAGRSGGTGDLGDVSPTPDN
jgi:hypothetical protein